MSVGRWLLVVLAAAVCVVTLVLLVRSQPTPPVEADELCWGLPCELVNDARADHGLPLLEQRGGLSRVADDWAHELAAKGVLRHNPDLTAQVCCWRVVAENVGYGPDVRTVHQAFMASPEHRDNILDPRFRRIGIGRERDPLGVLWLVQVFKDPA